MSLWRIVWGFNFWQLIKLSELMLKNPLFVFPTLIATKQTITICDRLYRRKHHDNSVANAFRHALWNVLICQKIYQVYKQRLKAAIWAKKITDLHEKISPNSALEMAMDLHNNEIGRNCFYKLKEYSEEEIIVSLQEKTATAKLITEITEIAFYKEEMVYIEL